MDICHRPIELAKCPFYFSVERTSVPFLSCQCDHSPVIYFLIFLVTLKQHIIDPVTGCSPVIRAYIQSINTGTGVGDEGDRQMGAKRKRVLFSRREEEQT